MKDHNQMGHIVIEPAWRFRDSEGKEIDPLLFRLLAAIREHGRLTAASRQIGYSYRHCWKLLNQWAAFFGTPLVELTQGRGARLAPLGETLTWAAERVQARLGPQLYSLGVEIDREINRAMTDSQPTLRVAASYGYAIALLPELVAGSGLRLELNYLGSVDALAAMNRGQADIAGFHVPVGPLAAPLFERYGPWLKPRAHRLIRLVLRTQGLLLAPGNPKRIRGLADLSRPDVRFVNRQEGSGTRLLLDELLAEARIDAAGIPGYGSVEFTHAAVAAHVASGQVDAGFGVKAAASRFGLDFLPLAQERYVLAMHKDTAARMPAQQLVSILAGEGFARAVGELAGYEVQAPGTAISIEELFSPGSADLGASPRAETRPTLAQA